MWFDKCELGRWNSYNGTGHDKWQMHVCVFVIAIDFMIFLIFSKNIVCNAGATSAYIKVGDACTPIPLSATRSVSFDCEQNIWAHDGSNVDKVVCVQGVFNINIHILLLFDK